MQYAYNDIPLRKQRKSNIIFPRQQAIILLLVFISCQLSNTLYFLSHMYGSVKLGFVSQDPCKDVTFSINNKIFMHLSPC
ncbi:hypothetical protein V1477_006231 [Vespula maculifrons]|uniref:Uncharacterized protein n=1 Tax=Vespula maculifrons TaxID=7453 RepID=A0ABD2CJV1_VESMC